MPSFDCWHVRVDLPRLPVELLRMTNPESDPDPLVRELERLNNSNAMARLNSTPKMMLHQLLRGLAFGLGTAIGASILVAVLVKILSNIDFIPIVGQWAAEIASQIQVGR